MRGSLPWSLTVWTGLVVAAAKLDLPPSRPDPLDALDALDAADKIDATLGKQSTQR